MMASRETQRPRRLFTSSLIALSIVALLGCSAPDELSLISWNVQNLFDDIDDGGEYPEFTRDGGWTRAAYVRRLERLDEIVRFGMPSAPEVVVLQEVEGPKVGAVIATDFLRRHRYVAGDPRGLSSTSVLVLSRRTPTAVHLHDALELSLVPGESSPRIDWRARALLEVQIASNVGVIRLLGAHWKSQSGGERETEPYRRVEARLARLIMQRGEDDALLVGDLNEDLDEFAQHRGAYRTAIMHAEEAASIREISFVWPHERSQSGLQEHGVPADAVTGWERTQRPWSYAFRGRWERLDHAFLALPSDLDLSLDVVVAPQMVADGVPMRFDSRSGYGFSDHFPILVTVSRPQARRADE